MCKAQAIIDELVSIGQGNRKDSGSTKECKWGTRVGMIYTFVVDDIDPLLVALKQAKEHQNPSPYVKVMTKTVF